MKGKLHAPTLLGLPVCGATGSCYYAEDPARVTCARCLRCERGHLARNRSERDPVRVSDPGSLTP